MKYTEAVHSSALDDAEGVIKIKRSPTPSFTARMACPDGGDQHRQPINRVNTTTRVQQLRVAMSSVKLVRGMPLKAYIITSDDEHQVDITFFKLSPFVEPLKHLLYNSNVQPHVESFGVNKSLIFSSSTHRREPTTKRALCRERERDL